MNKLQKLWCLTTLAATSTFFLAGFHDVSVSATNTPQMLPFSQNWTDTGLITADDNWSAVPGVIGYRGDDLTTVTATDPRTILADGSATPVDVIANQTNPDTLVTGGVAEFQITNPVVGLNGSGTADAPHIVIHLNTTSQSGIHFACNIRDLDASADDAAQQVDVQYRVGGTGSYTSVAGGYIADATTGGAATLVTPLSLNLPANANNQALVEIRVITTNAVGNDEWVGIDDISVTGSPAVAADAPVDFNGDGKTDFAVARNISSQLRWFYNLNGSGGTVGIDWGLIGDTLLAEDFDGDTKDDITAWRQSAMGSTFYILQSQTGTARIEQFGQPDDDATVVGDYDGDGKADPAVYRRGANVGQQSTWFYRGSLNNPSGNITFAPWGVNGDKVAPGDYDGDGKNDLVVARVEGANYRYWKRLATGAISTEVFGLALDALVPGDYDADTKTDLAVTRSPGGMGAYTWFIRQSGGGGDKEVVFGNAGTDTTAQGDYDGDGKIDIAIWRTSGQFWWSNSTNGTVQVFALGSSIDLVIAAYNRH